MDDICSWATKDVQILITINWVFSQVSTLPLRALGEESS